MKRYWRFATTALLLGVTAIVLEIRNGAEIIPARPPLSSFPPVLDGWKSSDLALTQEVLDVLGQGDFLLRDYVNPATNDNVSLFIAYFPSQRAGDTIHSPKNCLPGAGWAPVKADHVKIEAPGHRSFEANRYVIAKGEDRQLVIYWYWAHDRGLASEYAAKFYLVADSISMRRTDGSLIRLSTPVAPGESLEKSEAKLLAWTNRIVPLLNTYVPR